MGRRRGRTKQPPPARFEGETDLHVVLVLDVEATCEERDVAPDWVNEIIELPVVAFDCRSEQVVHEFRTFVRPTQEPRLTAFCTGLTGIEQAQVDAAPTLPEALRLLLDDLRAVGLLTAECECAEGVSFACDGPWDLRNFVLEECGRLGLAVPPCMRQWVDVRAAFARVLGTRRMNVSRMLGQLELEFEGRPHSGIDDSRNIARIAMEVARRGGPLRANDRFVGEELGQARRGAEVW